LTGLTRSLIGGEHNLNWSGRRAERKENEAKKKAEETMKEGW